METQDTSPEETLIVCVHRYAKLREPYTSLVYAIMINTLGLPGRVVKDLGYVKRKDLGYVKMARNNI